MTYGAITYISAKQIVKGATINHLDKDVIQIARTKYKEKMVI